jgi:hypothetical protein
MGYNIIYCFSWEIVPLATGLLLHGDIFDEWIPIARPYFRLSWNTIFVWLLELLTYPPQ